MKLTLHAKSWETEKPTNMNTDSVDPDNATWVVKSIYIQIWVILHTFNVVLCWLFPKNSFRIRISNGLDPYWDRCFIGPDLGPNCLQTTKVATSKERVHLQHKPNSGNILPFITAFYIRPITLMRRDKKFCLHKQGSNLRSLLQQKY